MNVVWPTNTTHPGTSVKDVVYTFDRPLALPDDLPQMLSKGVTNIYGVPYIIGAKKGFPNFNEFSFEYISQITRRVEINKKAAGAPRSQWQTNQMFQIGVSNIVGFEAWNSYSNTFPAGMNLAVGDDLRMFLKVSNSTPPYETNLSYPFAPGNFILGTNYIVPVFGTWSGILSGSAAFQTLRSNVVFVPDLAYVTTPPALVAT